MSISGALSNALSGLTAAARGAEIVSSNVAGATTEGYGRRVLETSSQSVGGVGAGVKIDGVRRDVDQVILADRRLADAAAGQADQQAKFYTSLEDAIGLPDDPNSLTGTIAQLESALVEAASRPDSDARLSAVATAASNVTEKMAAVSGEIQSLRTDADGEIAAQTDLLNDRLVKIDALNDEIRLSLGAGHDATALMDQRQALVDEISPIVPLRVVNRDHGEIAIYTTTGATLLDGKPSTFGFTQTGTIVPEMGTPPLSGLTLNGQPTATLGPYAPIAGGSLGALFEQRDTLAVEAQAELDAVARDLVERFEGIDPTQAPGAAGLITDQGAAFAAPNEVGLSARLQLNPVVDPAQGGALWHLRSGLGATSPGAAGDAALLDAFTTALGENRTAASGRFNSAARSASGLAAEYLSFIGAERQSAQADQTFTQTRKTTMRAAELAGGVDTDNEMQNLLLIEQAYSSNARVIQTIDDMIQTLLSM